MDPYIIIIIASSSHHVIDFKVQVFWKNNVLPEFQEHLYYLNYTAKIFGLQGHADQEEEVPCDNL